MDMKDWVLEQKKLIQAAMERLQADLNANIGAMQAFEAMQAKLDEVPETGLDEGSNAALRDDSHD